MGVNWDMTYDRDPSWLYCRWVVVEGYGLVVQRLAGRRGRISRSKPSKVEKLTSSG